MKLNNYDLLEVDCDNQIELYLVLNTLSNYVRYLSSSLDENLEIEHFNTEETTMMEVYDPKYLLTLDRDVFSDCKRERDLAEKIRHIYLERR